MKAFLMIVSITATISLGFHWYVIPLLFPYQPPKVGKESSQLSLEELKTPYPRDPKLPVYTLEYLKKNHNAEAWFRYLAIRGVIFDVS